MGGWSGSGAEFGAAVRAAVVLDADLVGGPVVGSGVGPEVGPGPGPVVGCGDGLVVGPVVNNSVGCLGDGPGGGPVAVAGDFVGGPVVVLVVGLGCC